MQRILLELRELATRLPTSDNNRLLALAVGLGLSTGAAIWLFRQAIDVVHTFFVTFLQETVLTPRIGSMAVVICLALVGAIVGSIMDGYIGQERHHGVAGIVEAVALVGGRLRYSRIPFKAVASALSLGAGASVGPEDPSVQIGANIGSWFGQRLRLAEEQMRLLVAAGAASAIAAAFKAPIAGVFFALEVVLNGAFETR
ncbi:MAG: chloride channel protein, partial [Chloroflexi bacterium]|nr:chloride channel protein [Chloroflexota bacterium]